ncbi:MAG: SGNH/GDSL hydrolase family protein [Ruminococcus sp.]
MKTIVFFGDSNTWGYNSTTGKRFPEEVRFTGLLEQRLKNCRIIEEGMRGRTHAFNDSLMEGRNGKKELPMILCTHDPVDILVIMLGTNDVKCTFRNSAYEIGRALERNIQIAQAPQMWDGERTPEILVVCPPGVTEDFKGSDMEGHFDQRSVEVSKELDKEFRNMAEKYGCAYLNAMEYTGPGKEDGVHLDAQGHRKLADALEQKIKEMI